MESLTLSVAIIASVLVLYLSAVNGLIVYLCVLAWYPSYLTVKVGTIDFNVCRIVIIVIFASLLLRHTDLVRKFKFGSLDILVIVYFVCQLIAGVTTTPLGELLENRGGAFFDTVLCYFAVRMIVTGRKEYYVMLKAILIIAIPLALVGFYECLTGSNPVGFLKKYNAWKSYEDYVPAFRHGFYRADVTFPMSIMFGLFFAMFGPVCAGLIRKTGKVEWLYVISVGIVIGLGTFSSVSSGPILAAALAIIFIAAYRIRKYWKIAAVCVVIMCFLVEIVSNRHFYDVFGGFTLSGRTAWYRTKLMEVALDGGMSGHWLTGFGFTDPLWSERIDHRDHTDIVNQYLLILCRYGLVGFVPFVAMIVVAIKNLVSAFRTGISEEDRWLVWCLSSSLFGLLFAFFSVSLFGQPTTFFFVLLAFCCALKDTMSKSDMNLIAMSRSGLLEKHRRSHPVSAKVVCHVFKH